MFGTETCTPPAMKLPRPARHAVPLETSRQMPSLSVRVDRCRSFSKPFGKARESTTGMAPSGTSPVCGRGVAKYTWTTGVSGRHTSPGRSTDDGCDDASRDGTRHAGAADRGARGWQRDPGGEA